MDASQITRVEGAVHNPSDPRHFMRIKPLGRRLRLFHDGALIAETTDALRVLEAGRDLYDPALYLPREAIAAPLGPLDLTTHCPIKGDAVYFNLLDAPGGAVRVAKIAWSYEAPIPAAAALAGRVSFYPQHVTVEESPL